MIHIQFPEKKPTIKRTEKSEEIFCIVRKKWLILTPEEWVRQNFILYLTETLKYPMALIAVEKQFSINNVLKRFDIVVYNNMLNPLILVECKEMNTPISTKALRQALHYYTIIQSDIFLITNGSYTLGFKKDNSNMIEIDAIPTFIEK